MKENRFHPQQLPASMPSLAREVPAAPPGTIFVKGPHVGYAVPPRKFTLFFGRDEDEVHVPVGLDDPYISRLHGVFICNGEHWWLRNEGRRPIRVPGGEMLLRGHELPIEDGYAPLTIETPNCRSHLVEVRIVQHTRHARTNSPQMPTLTTDVYKLTKRQHMVITSLAQRYLRRDPHPQPVTWKQVADDLNHVKPEDNWTAKRVEHIVCDLRKQLSGGTNPVAGLTREEAGEPVGTTLNHNLIQALLKNATLKPEDLHLLGEEA